ncbi:sodium:calcium antiporter [bacterium]|nr:sodium:calcium antiporter [bacterium]
MVLVYSIIFIVSCIVLVRSGTWVVRSLIRIAKFLGWKEFVVASILMAFATSLPEIFVGVSSALSNKPQLSFGNVIGSNILALTLVIGIGAILGNGLKFEGKTLRSSSIYAIIISLLPLFLILDRNVSRIDGVILLASLVFYFRELLKREEKFTKIFTNHFKRDLEGLKLFFKDLLLFFGGVFLLLISAEGVVFSSSSLSLELNLPLIVIGLFFVAVGTSIPEITFGIRSVMMGHKEMIAGDAIGSVVVNSALALGLVAVIAPFQIPQISFYIVGIVFTVITALAFLIFSWTEHKITPKEALILIEIYILFVLVEIIVK